LKRERYPPKKFSFIRGEGRNKKIVRRKDLRGFSLNRKDFSCGEGEAFSGQVTRREAGKSMLRAIASTAFDEDEKKKQACSYALLGTLT